MEKRHRAFKKFTQNTQPARAVTNWKQDRSPNFCVWASKEQLHLLRSVGSKRGSSREESQRPSYLVLDYLSGGRDEAVGAADMV